MTRLLLGTVAHNPHVQNMARALHETGVLAEYVTGGVDVFHGAGGRTVRRIAGIAMPSVDRELRRRAIHGMPVGVVRPRWRWELPRVAANRLHLNERLVDWLWERSELDLDRECARRIVRSGVGFVGVEHGALAALTAAKGRGAPAVVAFLSPDHRTLGRWLDGEYARFPELATPERRSLSAHDARRNARRDREAALADWVIANSSFTAKSLVDAGVSASKILTVPLGGPPPIDAAALPQGRSGPTTFVFVGPASVRKGAHHLLRAWKDVARPGLELHFYGAWQLPDHLRREATAARGGSSLVFHGSVPATELTAVYRNASLLVLPTLCDGFGMVVSEALAHGLPVVTTRNAGAADAIKHERTGFVIPAADTDALRTTLDWCASHPHEIFAMRRPALESAGRWTWADFRQRFIELLTTAIDGTPAMPNAALAAAR